MTDAWDGRPQNPERDGWHWLASSEGPVPALWARPAWRHCRDFWISQAEPEWMVRQGWRYLGPCLMPAEVEAERDRLRSSAFPAAAAAVRRMAARMRAMDPVRIEVLATVAALEQAADMLEAKGQEDRP